MVTARRRGHGLRVRLRIALRGRTVVPVVVRATHEGSLRWHARGHYLALHKLASTFFVMAVAIDRASEVVLRERVADFALRGFTVVPSALSADELSALNGAIDEDRAKNFEQWHKRGTRESGRTQSVDLLMATSAFDAVCAHPAVLPTLRRLLGEDVRQQLQSAQPLSAVHLISVGQCNVDIGSFRAIANMFSGRVACACCLTGVFRGILRDGT